MIALILLGILTAIALPAYQSHVAKGRRAEAINALSAVLQAQERWRSNRSSYASTLSDLGYADTTSPGQYYSLSLVGVGDPAGFTSGFEARAVPVASSAQGRDSDCADMSVRVQGGNVIYAARNAQAADSTQQCWPK